MESLETSSDNEQSTPASGPGPRQRILDAALELFVDKGYFNTNVPNISKKSRCSVGSIYHHFANKEEIAKQLYIDGIKRFRSELATSIADIDDAEECIKNMVKAFLSFACTDKLYAQYLWQARHTEFLSQKQDRPTAVGFDLLGRKLSRLFKKSMKEKRIRELAPELLWSVVFGIPIGYVRDWLDGYSAISPIEASEQLAESCWNALCYR